MSFEPSGPSQQRWRAGATSTMAETSTSEMMVSYATALQYRRIGRYYFDIRFVSKN
jgi:hypothetical protein